MQSTMMNDAMNRLRSTFDSPPSDMALIRSAVVDRAARLDLPEMPPILDDEQRKAFMDKVNLLPLFKESEDGADAIELLMSSWARFVADYEAVTAGQQFSDAGAQEQ